MTDTFTRDSDGKKWQLATCHGAPHFAGLTIIEPLPAPARTEGEIINEALSAIELCDYNLLRPVVLATIKAARELARMDLEKREK